MIIIRDNSVWWRRPDGAETQATPEQCAQEIERLQRCVMRLQEYNRAQDEHNERLRAALKSVLDAYDSPVGWANMLAARIPRIRRAYEASLDGH